MVCVCKTAVDEAVAREPVTEAEAGPEPAPAPTPAQTQLARAAHWLNQTWQPRPTWLPAVLDELDLDTIPEAKLPPDRAATLLSLVGAAETLRRTLGIDLRQPPDLTALRRYLRTLQDRLPALQSLDERQDRAWQDLAQRAHQAAMVRDALQAGQLDPAHEETPVPPDAEPARDELIDRLQRLAPLLATSRLAQTDLADPAGRAELARLVKHAAAIELPPADPAPLLRVLGRARAIAQVRQSMGADPRSVPFERVAAAVQRLEERVAEQAAPVLDALPPPDRVVAPHVTPDVIRTAQALPQDAVDQLQWRVPPREELDLLTTGEPALALLDALPSLVPGAIARSPCAACDARPSARGA